MVLTGLLLAGRLLGAQVPPDVLVKAQDDRVACKLADEAGWRLQFEPARSIGAAEGSAFHLQMLERLGDRVKYFQYRFGSLVAPNAQDLTAVSLPRSLSFLYYAVRPVRLLSTYGLMLLRLPVKMLFGK
jgi:hypothetical protein